MKTTVRTHDRMCKGGILCWFNHSVLEKLCGVSTHGPGQSCCHPRTTREATRHSLLMQLLRMRAGRAVPKGQERGSHLNTAGLASSKLSTGCSHFSRHPFHTAYWDPSHEGVKSFISCSTKHLYHDQIHRQALLTFFFFYHFKSKCRELFLFAGHWQTMINGYREGSVFWEIFFFPLRDF